MGKQVVVLTGAGISAESGVPTFRDSDGLWEGHHVEDVATPEAYERQPDVVLDFYDQRRAHLDTVEPNAGHKALAELEDAIGDDLYVVTQNVDNLHERGGLKRVHHMHGELLSAWCLACNQRYEWAGSMADRPECPGCSARELRPDIVWFGEMPYGMVEIERRLQAADYFISIGTSGAVYPAAGFVQMARVFGAQTIELNLVKSEGAHWFSEARQGHASELVPVWVAGFLAGLR